MASDDRRSCPIFRIERGTFQESLVRTVNSDYPSMHEDEDVLLRVTKLPSANNSPMSLNKTPSNNGRSLLTNSAATNIPYRDSWDDAGRSLTDNNNTRLQSLSDDYVFL
jgi:hypothetical protein